MMDQATEMKVGNVGKHGKEADHKKENVDKRSEK